MSGIPAYNGEQSLQVISFPGGAWERDVWYDSIPILSFDTNSLRRRNMPLVRRAPACAPMERADPCVCPYRRRYPTIGNRIRVICQKAHWYETVSDACPTKKPLAMIRPGVRSVIARSVSPAFRWMAIARSLGNWQ
jgi:hypothetical protein